MKRFNIILFIIIFWNNSYSQDPRQEYVVKYYKIAIREMNLFKIPASITIAQGLLESANGKSRLATEGSNHFGIKCHKVWTGPVMYHDDDAKGECFRVYNDAQESYRDHSLFLVSRDRYKKLFELNQKDYKSWAYGLKEAGYATNPNYPQILIKHIEELKLYEFDYYGSFENAETEIVKKDTSTLFIINQNLLQKKDSAKNKTKDSNNLPINIYRNNEDLTNNLDYIKVDLSFNIYEISKNNKISIKDLLSFNELESEQFIMLGQNFFFERKDRASKIAIHRATTGESIYDISQKYGVRQEMIRKYNKLDLWEQPQIGEYVYLNAIRPNLMKTRPFYEIQKEKEEIQYLRFEVKYKKELEKKNKTEILTENLTLIKPINSNTEKLDNPLNNGPKKVVHIVKENETIFVLAKKYGCKPSELSMWNKLDDKPIVKGQKLEIFLKD